ncbi:MAG: hypothetical protein KJ587_20075 [Alphaproteobacteria bacterium]|nr:hypothetical protein [Alphaproteobacteria bacterium]
MKEDIVDYEHTLIDHKDRRKDSTSKRPIKMEKEESKILKNYLENRIKHLRTTKNYVPFSEKNPKLREPTIKNLKSRIKELRLLKKIINLDDLENALEREKIMFEKLSKKLGDKRNAKTK